MDGFLSSLIDLLDHRGEHLLGRWSGPLHFRLVVMPLVVSFLAIRAHFRDVREGRPTEVGAFFTDRVKRRRLLRSGIADFGKVFVVACVLDTTYQIWVLRSYYLGEMLVVAIACAVVPYFLVRGPIARVARLLHRKWSGPAEKPTAGTSPPAKVAPRADGIKDTSHE